MKKILFICTGNTCRSPMAELLFRAYLVQNGLADLCTVESRGLMATAGERATEPAIEAMKLEGLDLSKHRATPFSPQDYSGDTVYVCMTKAHALSLSTVVPPEKILALDVADPYGGDLQTYVHTAKQLKAFCPQIFRAAFGFNQIRLMQKKDVLDVADIEKVSFSTPWTVQGIEEGLENPTGLFLVAESDSKIVGYVGANVILDEVYLNNIAVLPDFRGYGIGKALLLSLISTVKARNAAFVSLEVRESNQAAIKLYESLGFEKKGKRKSFYTAPIEDALILTKNL